MPYKDPKKRTECKRKWQRLHLPQKVKQVREWRSKNPETMHGYKLKYKYGMSVEEYKKLEKEQNGLCAICGNAPKVYGNKRLSVDHNHTTKKHRGLLCQRCNPALERMENVPEWDRKAREYLRRYYVWPMEKTG
jgi:Recombination endonuclease VII